MSSLGLSPPPSDFHWRNWHRSTPFTSSTSISQTCYLPREATKCHFVISFILGCLAGVMSFSPRAIKSLCNLIIVVFNEEKSNRNGLFFVVQRWSRKNIILLDCPAGVSNCVICLETGAGLGGKARWMCGCGSGGTRRCGERVQSGGDFFFLFFGERFKRFCLSPVLPKRSTALSDSRSKASTKWSYSTWQCRDMLAEISWHHRHGDWINVAVVWLLQSCKQTLGY